MTWCTGNRGDDVAFMFPQEGSGPTRPSYPSDPVLLLGVTDFDGRIWVDLPPDVGWLAIAPPVSAVGPEELSGRGEEVQREMVYVNTAEAAKRRRLRTTTVVISEATEAENAEFVEDARPFSLRGARPEEQEEANDDDGLD